QVTAPDAADTRHAPVWNTSAALAAMNGNRAHVDAMHALFIAELPSMRTTIEAAFAAGDNDAMQAALHRLRASCGFVGAERLEAAVRQLRNAPASAQAMAQFASALQDTLSS